MHEGAIGVFNGTDKLIKYGEWAKQRDKDNADDPISLSTGWLGITDKYWAATLIPPTTQPFQPRFAYFDDGRSRFQSDYLTDAITIAPGQSSTVETLVFAGAKEVGKIQAYETDKKIRQFDLLIGGSSRNDGDQREELSQNTRQPR